MRLINADALIKQFEWLELCRLSKNEIYQIIHESPTVAVNCNDCDGYEAGYSAGLKDAERPQGEWLHESILDYRCSICNSFPLDRGDYPELSAYCPHCGAKMEVQNEEDHN